MLSNFVLSLPIVVVASAREISFPSLSGFSSDQAIMGLMDPDITQAKFGGLTTYANLPYVHCLAEEGQSIEEFDIAILGAPFDTVRFQNWTFPIDLQNSRPLHARSSY